MVLDFKKLAGASSASAIIEPRKVFATLPSKNPQFKFLHDVQSEVLNEWFNRRSEKDLVIKMNTGSGKTLVGLLLLQSSLNEGCAPAVYIAPDKFLVSQVLQEAEKLGLAVTTDTADPAFLAGSKILVTNIYKLFNGRSVFGVGAAGSKIPIGSIIIDDAHACLATVREQFTLRIEHGHPAYLELLNLFEDELRRQSHSTLLDVKVFDPQAVMLVPFWVWRDNADRVMQILHTHRNSNEEFTFKWPLIRDILPLCRCAIGSGTFEIAPRCMPVDIVSSFDQAKRRIHATATLADDSILITEFQAAPESVSKPITPSSAGDIGDRMILAPQAINTNITDEEIRDYVSGISKSKNVVVIVPSSHRAEFWAGAASQVLYANEIWDGVTKLKSGGFVGLTVLVNRYDGIDLPGDACRVLVLDGLPEHQGLLERTDHASLDGTDVEVSRQVQRIEQGMGRGVRSNDDFCVVLLMGRRLIQRLHSAEVLHKFTPGTLAQLNLAKEVADQVKGKPLSELMPVIDLCLKQDADWVSASKKAIVGAAYIKDVTLSPMAIHIRQAFDFMRVQQTRKAEAELQAAVNACAEQRTKGWLMVALAEAQQAFDPNAAQQTLLSALANNKRIIRPIDGIAYAKLTPPALEQSAMAAEFMRSRYLEGNDLVISINGLLEDLKFTPNTASRFESAIQFLGHFLGFGSQRPETEFGEGPDNLWAIGAGTYFVIECKNGASSGAISKHDSNQLSGSMNWFGGKYPKPNSATPVIIHPVRVFSKVASPDASTRVIEAEGLNSLKSAILGLTVALSKDNAFKEAAKVGPVLDHYGLTAKKFLSSFSCQFSKET